MTDDPLPDERAWRHGRPHTRLQADDHDAITGPRLPWRRMLEAPDPADSVTRNRCTCGRPLIEALSLGACRKCGRVPCTSCRARLLDPRNPQPCSVCRRTAPWGPPEDSDRFAAPAFGRRALWQQWWPVVTLFAIAAGVMWWGWR